MLQRPGENCLRQTDIRYHVCDGIGDKWAGRREMIEAVARVDGLEKLEPVRMHFNGMVTNLAAKAIEGTGLDPNECCVKETVLNAFAPAVEQYKKMVNVLAFSAGGKMLGHAEVESGLTAHSIECVRLLCQGYHALVAEFSSRK